MPQPAGRRSPAFFPGGQSKTAVGPAFLAGFVPDDLTGILVTFQGFSELLGSVTSSASIPSTQRFKGLRNSHRFAARTKGTMSTRILTTSHMASFGYPSQRSP